MLLSLCAPTCIRQHATHPPCVPVNALTTTTTCCWRQPHSHFPTRSLVCTAVTAEDNSVSIEEEEEVEWVEIGRISVQHGVRGEVKVQPFTDFGPQRLGKPGRRCVC